MEAEAQFIHYQLKEAMPSLMKEGQQNDGRALYALGQIFLTQGIYTGDTRTLLRSMAAFSKGKEDSEEKVLCRSACCTMEVGGLSRTGKTEDDVAMADALSRMAEGGDVLAMTEWAACLLYGTGTEKDAEESLSWLRRAASQDYWLARLRLLQTDVLAMTEWAACLLYGTGTEKDAEESLSWLRRAASQDYWLARLRLLQTERLKEDRESRRDVFNQANHLALMGVPDGEFYLGECYEAGWGTEPAWNKAVHHYDRAYSLGNPAAAMRLANGYLRDTGNEESEAKAMEWLRLADEKGNGEASYRLGKVYASRGEKEKTWAAVNRACLRNYPAGVFAAGFLQMAGCGTKQDEKQGVYASRGEKEKTWAAVNRACLRNYPAGVFAAGFLQMAGCGTKQDEKQGMIKIRLAAQMGYIPAQMYLKNPENMAERLIHDWNV